MHMKTIDGTHDDCGVLDVLSGLIRARSQNSIETEQEAGQFIAAVLRDHGIETDLAWAAPGRPNVIARLRGVEPGRTLLLNGHLDTVPAGDGWSCNPFEATVTAGRLYGRGASDMKGGVAAMACAAIRLKHLGNPFRGDLVLFFNCDEECTNTGMKWFLESDIRMDYAVIGEPTSLDICTGHRGVARITVRTSGVAGHTCFVENPENAIYRMLPLVESVRELGQEVRLRRHDYLGNSLLTVSQINGGTAPNIVPDSCEIQIDRRTLPGETREAVVSEISQCVQNAAARRGVEFDLNDYLFLPATHLDHRHPLVSSMAASLSAVRGGKARIKAFDATCEAPFFAVDRNVPTLIIGPGSIAQAHIADEFVQTQEVVEAVSVYTDFVQRVLSERAGS